MSAAFQPFVYRCTFRGWYDGDSPTLDIDLGFRTIMHEQKIRLYGINTPEIRGEERPASSAPTRTRPASSVGGLQRSTRPAGQKA